MSGLLPAPPAAGAFTRRSLLVATLAGTALVAAGCTGTPGDVTDAVTPAQVDQLAAQVRVQEAVVTAYDQALSTSPELAASLTPLAAQALAQLDRLRGAAPGDLGTTAAATSGGAAPTDPTEARAWLRGLVGTAAAAHAAACPEFTGGRAALLGSIAAGLRGQETVLA
ncbi:MULTISPECIES: hypothetical protein [unclassified Modestobacter]|uniref:hypothetical protein n=1 Tax=unclassified Modestobacter TaxID=2643866 RepID=UPI0022AA7B26|nr:MULTISPECIES: hypothetical protein [unclassified Modestobacter]MCZ2824126.1 hypothetical protein [Modestobacter sp. VKM Ac-2981]MCZ2852371.1 hypothetical protein [Modestobacter sp. VKM Ac-2982]